MLRTIIVDDEKSARESLASLLQTYCPLIEIIGTADSVKQGIAAIEKHKPHLVFLDVQMQDGSGFNLLEALPENNFEVIFTTAYDQYALKAIKFSALDYLLKPINIEELKLAVQKAIDNTSKDDLNKRVISLLENIKQGNIHKKIALPFVSGFRVVDVNFIIRCQADRNYTHIYLSDGSKETASKSLKEFEDMLSEHSFFRTHQSHLINLNHVKNYLKGRGGQVELTDGSVVEVARTKKDEFVKLFA